MSLLTGLKNGNIISGLKKMFIQVPSTADSQTQNNWRFLLDELNLIIDKANEIVDIANYNGFDTYKVKIDIHDPTPTFLKKKISKSIIIDSNKIALDGDELAPGNNKVYGTDGTGVKKWKADPAGGSSHAILSTTHTDTTISSPNNNDVLTWDSGTSKWIAKAGGGGGGMVAHVLDGVYHTVSGLTAGYFLKALTATTFGFAVHGLTYTDVGALAVGGTAADSDKVDGQHASAFLGVSATAADSDKVDGQHASAFLGATTQAVDSDKLDGQHASAFLTAVTPHNILSTTHGDTTVSVPNNNDVLTWNSASSKWIAQASSGGMVAHQLDGALHTVSGLTAGHFLKALTATTFGFAAHGLTYSDVGALAVGGTAADSDKLDGQHASAFLTSVTAHNLLSTTHGDSLADTVVAGDIMFGNATPKWARLAKATDGWVLTLVSGLPAWVANSSAYTDEMAQDAVGAMIGSSLRYVDATPLLDTIQDIRTTAYPTFSNIAITDNSTYSLYYAGLANGDAQFIISHPYVSHNFILGKYGTAAYDGVLRLQSSVYLTYADLTYTLLSSLQSTGSPSFVGLTLSGMASAGWVKNAAGGLLSGGNSIVQADVGGLKTTDSPTFVNVYASCITDPVAEAAASAPVGRADGHLWYDTASSPASIVDEKVKGSAGDSTAGYLDAKVANSVVVSANTLQLSGDATTPGNSKYYGTSSTGTKGYNDLPAGLVGTYVPRAAYKHYFSLTPHQALAHGINCVGSTSGTLAMTYSAGVASQTLTTAATAASYSAVYTALMISELANPDYNVLFTTSSAIDNEYIWAGLFSDITVTGTADPKTRNIVALRYASGTANWYLYNSNGASSNAVDTGVVVATSTEYLVRIWTTDLGVTWNLTINGANLTQSSTNVPTGPYISGLKVETKANSARNISWKWMEQFHG